MTTNNQYPIFLECFKYIKDDFWLCIFQNLAKGKTPYGIHINDEGTITTHYKNKNVNYNFIGKEPKNIYNDLKQILLSFGLRSQLDKKSYKKILTQQLNDITENRKNSWKSIKRESIKRTLLCNYILKMGKKYKFTLKTKKKLLTEIYININMKLITTDDIFFENGLITKIDFITFSHNNFKIKSKRTEKKDKPKNTEEGSSMIENWIKLNNKKVKKK